jgi:hypothetical protein
MVLDQNEQIPIHNSYLEGTCWETFDIQTDSIIGISNNNDEIFGPLLKPPSVDTISIGNVTLFHKIIVCCNGGSNMHVRRNGTFFQLNMLTVEYAFIISFHWMIN